ncbi:MAG: hypothetical protein V4534_00065 [Myxococcota bacterium]
MYPLQTLFEIRERAKKASEESYSKEKQKLNEAEKKLHQMEDELKAMKAAREQKRQEYFDNLSSGSLKIDAIKMGHRHLEMLEQKEELFKLTIEEQKRVVQAAQARVKEALEAMTKATEDYKVLEKHKEKWAKGQKKELEKKEEEEADDITQSRYTLHLKELKDDQPNR